VFLISEFDIDIAPEDVIELLRRSRCVRVVFLKSAESIDLCTIETHWLLPCDSYV